MANLPLTEERKARWRACLGAGLEGGETIKVVFELGRFVLAKFPGRMFWSGLGSRSYGRTTYAIVEKGRNYLDGVEVHEGRATKRDRTRMENAVMEAERTGQLPERRKS